MTRCRFVEDHQRRFGVKRLCDILGISRSSFYYWRRTAPARVARQAADARLAARIRKVHEDSDGTYGAPRITAELRDDGGGQVVNHKRVARIMRTIGLEGVRLRLSHISSSCGMTMASDALPTPLETSMPTPIPMLAIKGTYRIINTRPDGDTVSFLPQDPGFWCDVPGNSRVERNSRGGGTVRMDAIDALETHYKGVGPNEVHQPLNLGARAARDELLSWLGFGTVLMDEKEKVTASTPETVPGFILASGADTFGRCIALVGRGDLPPGLKNGKRTVVTTDHMHQTANHRLLELGLVYPTFYSKLPEELRDDMAKTTRQARAAKAPNSVWAKDVTFEDGAKIEDLNSITAHQVILPKLFRRLADYIRLFGPSLTCFPAYLAGEYEEFRLSGQEKSIHGLQHVIEITDNTIRMTRLIEDITIVEK